MATNANEQQEARDIVAEVLKEEEATQAAPAPTEPAKPEPKPEAKVEPKPEEPAKEPEAEKKLERPAREPQYVPVKKANEWRHEANESKAKVAELEKQIAALKVAPAEQKAEDLDAIAKEIAGEDASPTVVKRIIEAVRKLTPASPTEDIKAVLEMKQSLEASNLQIKQAKEDAAFQADLNETLTKYPELKGHEAELKETAYAEGNEKIPLEYIALKMRADLNLGPAAPSAEGKATAPKAGIAPDFDNLSAKEVEALEGKELDAYIKHIQGSASKRTGLRL